MVVVVVAVVVEVMWRKYRVKVLVGDGNGRQ